MEDAAGAPGEIIIMIIIISIFKEDNISSMTANLPYSPPMNTDNDYYRPFFSDLFISDAMLVVRYMLEKHLTHHMSYVVRKPTFAYAKKDLDQLHSKCAADQHLCFRYIDSTFSLFSKSQISSLLTATTVQPGLCLAWSIRNPEDTFCCDVACTMFKYDFIFKGM